MVSPRPERPVPLVPSSPQRCIGSIALIEWKLFWRIPQAAFWTFFFPLFLLLLLGSVLGARQGHEASLVPGVTGMVLASTSYYSIGTVIAHYRSSGFLKRLALVPIPTWQFLAGQMLSRGAVVLLSGLLLAAAGRWVLGVPISAHPLTLGCVLAVGIPAFLATGFAVGSVARSVEGANSMAALLFFPMTFLCGAYFPVHSLPGPLQALAAALPLTHFLDGLRAAISGAGPHAVVADLIILTLWGLVGSLVSVSRFRWTT